VGTHERLWRWCRREPAVASLALALAAGLVGVAAQWWRAESHLRDAVHQRGRAEENARRQAEANRALLSANDRERAARRRAQERFDAAMGAMERFEEITKDESLVREPHQAGPRAKLLRTALGFYRELQASLEEDASPEPRSQLSDAYASVAAVTWELGLQEETLAAFRRSLALVEQIAETDPTDPKVRASLGRGHARVGFTLRTTGRPAEALDSYEQARRIQEPLALDNPANARYRQVLSWTLSNLGVIHLELGHPAEAIRYHRQAIVIHEALVSREPGNAKYRSDLGWCQRYLSLALAASGELTPALRLAERAAALHEELVRDDRGEFEFRWRLARCLDEVGRIRSQSGRPAEAADPLERAARLYEELTRDNPVLYGVDLARNQLFLASQRTVSGRHEEAMASLRRAEEVLVQTSQVRPGIMLFDMACAYSLWSVSGQDGGIASAEREARAQRSIAALRRAVVAGNRDLEQIRHDPVLDPFRPRRDFQHLMMDLSLPEDPFHHSGNE
jgi:eukaryotic-like serine/threonine-protein kinase